MVWSVFYNTSWSPTVRSSVSDDGWRRRSGYGSARLCRYWWRSFSTLKAHVSSDWRATSPNMHHERFLVWVLVRHFYAYFKYESKPLALQHYHTPNNSSTTKNALFHVKGSKTVVIYKLRSCAYIVVSLYCAQVQVLNATKLWLHNTPNDHHTTNNASFVQLEMSYDFWSAV